MKKVFAIAIVVAMVLALFVIPSHAGGNLCVDGAYLTNDADVSGRAQPWVPAEGEPNLAGQTKAGDLGNIYNSGFAYFHAQGWWSDDEELSDLGIQINSGSIEWGYLIYDEALVGNKALTGHNYPYRYSFTLPLQEGEVTVKLHKKLAAGGADVFHTFTYANAAPTGENFVAKPIAGNDPEPGNAVWLNEKGEYAAVKFTTTAEIGGVDIFHWASNGSNGPLATWQGELFKFDTDLEMTFSKAPVLSRVQESTGDNDPVFAMRKLDDPIPAGTYVLRFMINNDEASGVSGETSYVVFPATDTAVDETKFEYFETAGRTFNFAILGPDNVAVNDFYAANPAGGETPVDPGTTPGTNPVTGDAAIVLFVVAAAAVALVILKKRAF